MTKVHLLGANKSYDRSVQTVSVNQVVVLEGYSYDSYVVYEVTRDKWGITYHLVNLRTHEFHTSDLIRPLSEKFGIGIYYDDANPKFLDPLETAALLTKAKEKKAEEEKKAKVVVADEKLSLAIGKQGQNARLAAKLTGWKIDVKPYSEVMKTLSVESAENENA